MKRLYHCLLTLAATLVLIGVTNAQKEKDSSVNPAFTFSKAMKPVATEDQIKKLAPLEKEYQPKIDAHAKKVAAILTPERKKAADEAAQKAIKDGKTGGVVRAAYQTALKLTEEEQATLKKLTKQEFLLMAEIGNKKWELLTDDQKVSLKPKLKDKPKEPKKSDK